MGRLDRRGAREVSDGAGQLQHPVVRSGRKLELAHRRLHQAFAGVVQGAPAPQHRRAHLAVGQHPRVTKAFALDLARRRDSFADRLRGLSDAGARQFLVVNPWHLNMDIDPVEQRPRQPLLVAADRGWGAGAGAAWVSMVAARACPNVYSRI